MIKTNELRGKIAKNGLSRSDVALKIGVFGSDEIQIMIDLLNIDNPADIFLQNRTLKVTKRKQNKGRWERSV